MRLFLLSAILSFSLLKGCQQTVEQAQLESKARDVSATAQGYISQAQTIHRAECIQDRTKPVCQTINQAVGAQNALLDAIETYCGWPVRPTAEQLRTAAGTSCKRSQPSQEFLQNSISNLSAIMEDIKSSAK